MKRNVLLSMLAVLLAIGIVYWGGTSSPYNHSFPVYAQTVPQGTCTNLVPPIHVVVSDIWYGCVGEVWAQMWPVTAAGIDTSAVTSAKIAAGAVTSAKVAAGAITNTLLDPTT